MSGRKILQPLQPVANNQHLLVGGNGFIRLSKKDNEKLKTDVNEPDSLKVDFSGKQSKKRSHKSEKALENCRQTKESDTRIKKNAETDSEIRSWMSDEIAPEGYWKAMAEQRRIALMEALEENKSLYKKLEAYERENQMLKTALAEVLDEAKELIEFHEEFSKDTQK